MLSTKETVRWEYYQRFFIMMIKCIIPLQDTIILNMQAPSNKTSKAKEKLIQPKGERDKFESPVGDLNTNCSVTDRTSSQKSVKVEI